MNWFERMRDWVKAAGKRPETRILAPPGIRDRWGSYPSNGLTPVRLAQILKSADSGDVSRQAELFEEMEEKDGHLFSQLQTRKLAVQGLPWDVTPGDESAKAKEIAKEAEAMFGRLESFDDHILDMLDSIGKGYSLQELLWDASAGQAEIIGMEWIHPKLVTFWNSMEPRVLTEAEPAQGIALAPAKWVYHRYKARSGYDTRAGILRVCAWMYLFKNYAVKDWVAFAEVFGKPVRLGKYDFSASMEDRDALKLAVQMLGSDACGIISKSTEIEFVEATRTGTISLYEKLTNFCDAQISKAILGQTLTSDTGSSGHGSRALGTVHNEVRGDLTRADAKALGRTVTQQIIRPWVGFNFGWDAPMPRATPIYEEPEDLEAVGKVYQVVSGLVDISQEHVSERFKIPLIKKGETPIRRQQAAPSPALESAKAALKARAPEDDPSPVGLLAERMVEEAAPAWEKILDHVRRLADEAPDLASLQEKLLAAYADLPVRDLGEVMARGFAASDLAGRYDLDEESE